MSKASVWRMTSIGKGNSCNKEIYQEAIQAIPFKIEWKLSDSVLGLELLKYGLLPKAILSKKKKKWRHHNLLL